MARIQSLGVDPAPGAAAGQSGAERATCSVQTAIAGMLQCLSSEGYITLEANRGETVSSMDRAIMRNIFQSVQLIYTAIAMLATERATHGQNDELKAIQGCFEQALLRKVAADMSMLNYRCHEQLGLMAASP